MKKILFLLLFTIASYGQAVFDEGIQVTNSQSTTATKVNVQETDGVINWQFIKDFQNNKPYFSTGLLKNGLLTINADNTKFDLSAGIGVYSDFSDPENVTSKVFNFPAFSAVISPYIATSNITYVAVNYNGGSPVLVMQASQFSNAQIRDLVVVGAVVHSDFTTINVINNISSPSNDVGNSVADLFNFLGARNQEGNVYSANGANLQLNKSAGVLLKYGANFHVNSKNPHNVSLPEQLGLTFRYRLQGGFEGTDRINVDVDNYDLNNVLTAVPNNKYTIQTIFIPQTGQTRIQYGQTTYNTLAAAIAAINTRKFNVETNLATQFVKVAYLVVKKGTTSLQVVTDADIIQASKFDATASGGVAITYQSIIDALTFTPENVVNKATDFTTVNNTLYPTVQAVNSNFTNKTDALKSYSSNKKIVDSKKALFSFIWDDIQTSDLNVYNIFQEYGYVPNYALTTSALNSSNKDLYIDFYKKGCSILAHSVTHPDMSGTTLTNSQVNSEMVSSKKAIEDYGIRVSGWVTPSSALNPIYYPEVDKNFGYGFVYPSLTGAYNRTVNKLRLSRISLEEAMYGHNLANVKAIIDDAIANNKLITFYAHSLPSTYLNTDSTPSLTETDLRDILAYLKTKSDENLCYVLSTDEAIKNYYSTSIISDDGSSVNVSGAFRVNKSIINTYSPFLASGSVGNLTSFNNTENANNNSSLSILSANRSNGVNASIYLGVVNTSTDYQSMFVVGRKIDADNYKESFRVSYNGHFLLNRTSDSDSSFLQLDGGITINDASSGNSFRINRGTGGVLFASSSDIDEIAIYNKSGTVLYQKWSPTGVELTGTPTATTATAGTNTTQIATTAFVQTAKSSILSEDNVFTGSQIFNDTVNFNNLVLLKSYTVATLPTGSIQGAIAYVTDGLSPTYRGTATGGGSEKCLVFYDGAVWRF